MHICATKKLLHEMGTRIYAKRGELGITQEQLPEKMDISIKMISNLEGGKRLYVPRIRGSSVRCFR